MITPSTGFQPDSALRSYTPYAPWTGESCPYALWKGDPWEGPWGAPYLPFDPYPDSNPYFFDYLSRQSQADNAITCAFAATESAHTWDNRETPFSDFAARLADRERWSGQDRFVSFAHLEGGKRSSQTALAANTFVFTVTKPHDFRKLADSLIQTTSFLWSSCNDDGTDRVTYIAIPTGERICFSDYESSLEWAQFQFFGAAVRCQKSHDLPLTFAYILDDLSECLPLPTTGDGLNWETQINRGMDASMDYIFYPDPEPTFAYALSRLSKKCREWSDIVIAIRALERESKSKGEIAVGIQEIHERTDIGLKLLRAELKGSSEEDSSDSSFRYPRDSVANKKLHKRAGGKYELPNLPGCYELAIADVDGVAWIVAVEEKRDVKVCTPLGLLGGAHFPEKGGVRKLRVAIYTVKGESRIVEFDPGDTVRGNGNELLSRLMNMGLAVNPNMRSTILSYLAEAQLAGPSVFSRPGWKDGHYVSPTGKIYPPNPSMELAEGVRLKCKAEQGSPEKWREAIHKVFSVPHAKPQQATILAGLTGPITALAHDDATAYYLQGPTGSSKSTSQEAAAANVADPDKKSGGANRGANGTVNSQEAGLEAGASSLTSLDEISLMPASQIQALIFMGQSGQGKGRLEKTGDDKVRRKWDGGCLILSGEHDLAQRLAAEGVTINGGLSARVLTILFSKKNALDDGDFLALKQVAQNFGWGFPAFVQALIDQEYVSGNRDIRSLVESSIDLLAETKGKKNIQRRRSARMIGYIAAAGIIAQKAGIIPADYDVAGLCDYLWADFTASDLAPIDPAIRAVDILCGALVARKGLDIFNISESRTYREAAGYFGAMAAGEAAFIVRADKLVELSGGAAQQRLILEALEEAGILIRNPNKSDCRTWDGFAGLASRMKYVALRTDKLEAREVVEKTQAQLEAELRAAQMGVARLAADLERAKAAKAAEGRNAP